MAVNPAWRDDSITHTVTFGPQSDAFETIIDLIGNGGGGAYMNEVGIIPLKKISAENA